MVSRSAVIVGAFAAIACTAAAPSNEDAAASDETPDCIMLDGTTPVTVSGRLTVQLFAGPPNYESVAAGDTEERAYILELSERICVDDKEGFADPTVTIDRAHISADQRLIPTLASAIGHSVTVSGEGFGAHTGHHRAPLVIIADENSVR